MNRPYRVIKGIAYPHLIRGKNKTNVIKANIYDREEYYYDDAIRLSEDDIKTFKNLVGQPICVEHNTGLDVGTITHSWTDAEGKLRFMGRVYLDTDAGKIADAAIKSGELKGISVGYTPHVNRETMKVSGKTFKEVSLCRQGFFPGARIEVTASDAHPADAHPAELRVATYNSTEDNSALIFYKISAMSEEKSEVHQPPATAPSGQGQGSDEQKNVSELARQTDEMIRKNEELSKQLQEERSKRQSETERLAAFEQKEAERRKKYEADKAAELTRILEIQRQQYKDIHGDTATLPKEYEESAAMAFRIEEAAPQMQAITASAMAYQKQKDQNAELLKRITDMEGRIKKLDDVNQVAMGHVAATRRRIFSDESEKEVPAVTATAAAAAIERDNMSLLFVPKASAADRELYQMNYGSSVGGFDVNASSELDAKPTTYEAPPVHAHLDWVRNSMRHKFPHIFTHMIHCDPTYEPSLKLDMSMEINGKPVGTSH
jgi:hypothetical protein